jgi:hypothetical protein
MESHVYLKTNKNQLHKSTDNDKTMTERDIGKHNLPVLKTDN